MQIACERLTVSNLCGKFESSQCRQMLSIVGSWHVNLVLFRFDGGQVLQRCLVSRFTQGCSAKKRGARTAVPHQIKRKTAPNISNKVSIRL